MNFVPDFARAAPTPAPAAARPVALVAGADENYAPHLAVSLFSALSRLPRGRAASAWILDGGVAPDTLARVRATLARAHPAAAIHVLRPDLDALPEARSASAWITRATLLRLLIPATLPPEVGRALYLDADTVVVEDVSPLFDMPLDGLPLCAVADVDAAAEAARLAAAGLRDDRAAGASYFNAGVLLMDLAACRRLDVTGRALALFAAHGERLAMADQDALNIVVGDAWGRLPEKWNNQISDRRAVFPALARRGRAQGVLHWLGARKPWLRGRPCLRAEVYDEALARSGWLAPRALAARRLRRAGDAALFRARATLRALRRGVAAAAPLARP